ncbi:hypothetical protein [Streptomyces sp. CNQ085]|uniref:hypothetical protein n=1 Tax=Streptomyces sp. CNQ085 TaxID=2886944 RepID=UPI001F5132A2|nr:hypothetical protein [Streptomyces sp. CNQ085]MCI0383530.1 hypothetical protein [Streptomyces sp. CNQ085]
MRSSLAAAAALCAVAAPPGAAAAAPSDGPDDLPAYETAPGAQRVEGQESSAHGPAIEPGFHTDDIGPGERRYYSVTLDGESNVWISATALPEPGSRVRSMDGIEVTLESADGDNCGDGDASFGSDDTARPIADLAGRMIREDGYCQEPGVYHFSVERESDETADSTRWPLEISFMREPGVRRPASEGTSGAAPDAATPSPPAAPKGETRPIEGGTGFNDAPGMGEGNWSDRLRPGETRFYKVPLDWGQRLHTRVEFGTARARSGGASYIGGAFRVDFYNTARGRIGTGGVGYRPDKPAAYRLDGQRVAFANRFDGGTELGGTRFAGWYHIAVHANGKLAESVEGTVPVVLRTTVVGEPEAGPEYEGNAGEAGFAVTDGDREAAAEGLNRSAAESGDTLRLLGWAGIGVGTALILGLGLWTFLARRSAARA